MKKIAFLFAAAGCAILVSSCGTSLPVSPAETLANSAKPNFAQARVLAAKDRTNSTLKDTAHPWFASGYVEHKVFDSQYAKMVLPNQKADTTVMFNALLAEYPFFLKAYELDQNNKVDGKVKPIFTSKIKEYLSSDHKFFMNAGYYFLQKEDYTKSSEAFKDFLAIRNLPLFKGDAKMQKVDSTVMDATYLAIASAYQNKDYKQVIELANKAKDMKYNQDNIYQMLASSYALAKDTTDYMKVLEEGAQKFDNPFYLGNIVNVYSQRNDLSKAITYLEQAIAKKPKNLIYLNAMGSLYERKEDWKKAGEWYQKILAIDANNFDGNYNYARTLYNQAVTLLSAENLDKLSKDKAMGLYREAIPYFEEAYKIKPQQVYYVLSSVYNALGMTDKYNEVMKAKEAGFPKK